jgi:hypothetical protein
MRCFASNRRSASNGVVIDAIPIDDTPIIPHSMGNVDEL